MKTLKSCFLNTFLLQIEAVKRSLEEALAQNLVRRQEELRKHLSEINDASRGREVEAKKEQRSMAEGRANEAEVNKKGMPPHLATLRK